LYEDVSVTPVPQLMNTPHQKSLLEVAVEAMVGLLSLEKDAEIYPKIPLRSSRNGFLIIATTLILQTARK
jgi:hypothetical protein